VSAETSVERVGYQTRSLTRALAILDAFIAERRALSLKDLHELLGIPKPTLSRLARELERRGYLRANGRLYELGPKSFELGASFDRRHRINDFGKVHLDALAAQTLQTASMALLTGTSIVHVLVSPSARPVHHVTEVGSRAYAHCTALGKAMLSRLPEGELLAVFDGAELPRLTPNTICELDELVVELERTRKRGYALDDEETALGLRCVGVAVDLPGVGPAGISVSGPAADFRKATIERFAEAVVGTAQELSVE
jgi:IclR family transcriptional regulator, acetate operon repressor